MILYNVTVNIDLDVEQEWLEWMKKTHIPNVMATGIFSENRFYRLLHDGDEGGVNYAVQYFTDSIDKIMEYQEKFAPALQAEVKEKFDGKYVTFRSLLESV